MQKGDVLRGKYRLVRLLGDGGMGAVYEANHEGLGTRVAIKVLHAELARRQGLIERFLREARVSAQIKSPNVVQVMDVEATDDGVAYIVMELLEGEPLSALMEREGKLPVPLASDYTVQILHALEAAHALGVVHRDLKPENVFVTLAAGKPLLKLIDFGIAKVKELDSQQKNLTIAGVVMGTPEYMAPEQAHSADKVDARSDIYAVGVMLYEMLAGSRPATGEDARMVALKVERGEVKPLVHAAPGVPPDLAGLVHRAMAARPELRFGTAAEMRLALETTAGKRPGAPAVAIPTPSAVRRTSQVPLDAGNHSPSAVPGRAASTNPAAPPSFTDPGAGGGGRGTVMSDPTGEGLHPAQHVTARPTGAFGSPPQQYPGYQSAPPAPPARPRAKKGMSAAWIVLGLPVVMGGVIALVFAMGSTGSGALPKPTTTTTKPPPPAPVDISPSQTTPSAPVAPATTDTVAPLTPAGPVRPAPQFGVKPHPSASASASASAAPSASAPPESAFPFPSLPGIPNPFPSPSSSGMGPVFTLPTSLPFPFPGSQPPAPSAPPAHSAAPPPGGKAI
jgi:eukaryotic-like serine/threonine-protein kinase